MTHPTASTALSCFTLACMVTALLPALTLRSNTADAKDTPKHMVCSFTSGTTTIFEDGKFNTGQPKPLAFEISQIDLERQSANLVGNGRKAPGRLKIVRAINANHFIEVVNEGYMNLTTIYDADPESGKFPAVHSRHLGILGQPIFAQYTGLCTSKK